MASETSYSSPQVIRMLFVVVAEFFICWAPLHVLNTWYLFSPDAVYKNVGRTGVALVHLLAYISSCCNPITYCFMNRKFRAAFLGVFGCRSVVKSFGVLPAGETIIVIAEVLTLEAEDRV
ncbi:cholecystokinin receptor-like [Schistocerca piceifrons]|uniref:cholecystokinin receptor-like n=1 Tax=Schistocerca piceifrons TaxID=274613 RepID=UPI001F5FC6DC|nr:cholecystokinin receptor-like [Schistocerca piceifrons]